VSEIKSADTKQHVRTMDKVDVSDCYSPGPKQALLLPAHKYGVYEWWHAAPTADGKPNVTNSYRAKGTAMQAAKEAVNTVTAPLTVIIFERKTGCIVLRLTKN
jgi:hypothetical protein